MERLPRWRRYLLLSWTLTQFVCRLAFDLSSILVCRLASNAWHYSIAPAALVVVAFGSRRSAQWLRVRDAPRSAKP